VRVSTAPYAKWVHVLDFNHDGKVTREEFADSTSWFNRIAKNGGITKDDFVKFLDGDK